MADHRPCRSPPTVAASARPRVAELCLAARDALARRSPRCRHGDEGRRAARDRRRARGADGGDPRGQRARHGGRPRGRARRRAARPPRARRRARRARWPTACARSPRCPTRSARSSTASGCPTASTWRKVRVPLGVVAVVYEARPNVTIDAAALCLKSGNAIVLRGSSSRGALQRRAGRDRRAGRRRRRRPEGAIVLVAGGGREELAELATQDGRRRPDHPARRRGAEGGAEGRRDGAGDLRRVGQLPRLRRRERRPRRRARHRPQRQDPAPRRLQRGRDAARARRRRAGRSCRACSRALRDAGVELRVDGRTHALAGDALAGTLADATDEDWDTEFLALILAVGVVDSRRRGDRARQRATAPGTRRRS